MAFVFTPTVTRVRSGRKIKRRSRFYWASLSDAAGEPVRKALKLPNGQPVSDRETAEQVLRQLIRRTERRAVGLIDRAVESAGLPLRVALARFARYMRQRKLSYVHVRKTLTRVKWIADTAGIIRLADVNAPNVSKSLAVLAGRNRAPKTYNDYRAAMFGFCRWAVSPGELLDRNPMTDVTRRDIDGDIRKVRRALTPQEAGRLLAAAGPRALWYETAMLTGLRCGEMARLEWRDVDLVASRPGLTLRAEATKARRADIIPLKASLATKLRELRPANTKPTDRVFPRTPKRETFRADCDRAGVSWKADDRGRTLDRHSLRTTFVSWLGAAGVDPQAARQLARHTDIRLTMQTYTDPRLINTAAAVEHLPDVGSARPLPDAEPSRKLGTNDAEAVVLPVVLPVAFPVVLHDRERLRTDAQRDNANEAQVSVSAKNSSVRHASARTPQEWRRGESNPRPEAFQPGPLRVCPADLISAHRRPTGRSSDRPAPLHLIRTPRDGSVRTSLLFRPSA
ncbi:Tyrosine recombinase XerC [Phycisphaerae bacterium RAS1]|nr:Tyrosine recombinase XerC [Phycisphaerae bacterium RAS1]